MKAICVFSSSFPPDLSGQSVILRRLLEQLAPDSYSVLTYRTQRGKDSQEKHLSAKYFFLKRWIFFERVIEKLPIFRLQDLLTKILILIRSKAIAKVISCEDVKIMVVCSGGFYDLPSAHLACKQMDVELVPYFFDDYSFQWRGSLRILARRYEKQFMEYVDRYYCPNPFLEHEYNKRCSKNGIIVYNMLERGDVNSTPIEFNEQPQKVVTFAGSIYHANVGSFQAFQTMIASKDRKYSYTLSLCVSNLGGKAARRFLESGNFSLIPAISAGKLKTLYANSDLLLLPLSFASDVEEVIRTAAPGKLAEYLHSGTPVLAIVPSTSFVHWYLNEYQCGITINETELDSGLEKIERILSDLSQLRLISQNARKRAQIDFSFEKNYLNFLAGLKVGP